jgi:hypothetical protein
MSEQTGFNSGTKLSTLAEQATANSAWWKEEVLTQPSAFALPTRVLVELDSAGITTVEQLKQAGPHRLRRLDGLGRNGFEKIVELLRALDRQSNNGES